ncbi:hypothetical protein AMECASPLE_031250 [Ameca splendens]|uniref:Uncharacterized protein n=1 Tax=Ameca splendens TaxID=208324 RepID=A0ABV0ZFX3_9TELE
MKGHRFYCTPQSWEKLKKFESNYRNSKAHNSWNGSNGKPWWFEITEEMVCSSECLYLKLLQFGRLTLPNKRVKRQNICFRGTAQEADVWRCGFTHNYNSQCVNRNDGFCVD